MVAVAIALNGFLTFETEYHLLAVAPVTKKLRLLLGSP
jgi:hypothetical protein